jgi:hypothetical protein
MAPWIQRIKPIKSLDAADVGTSGPANKSRQPSAPGVSHPTGTDPKPTKKLLIMSATLPLAGPRKAMDRGRDR